MLAEGKLLTHDAVSSYLMTTKFVNKKCRTERNREGNILRPWMDKIELATYLEV
jgi:hypothetical protein